MIKKTLATLLAIGATGFVGSAGAGDLPHYGCTVLMCLSNPSGPKAAPYCAPFIDQLYDDLRHDRGFPSCDEGGGKYAQQVYDPYDPCPDPLKVAPQGSYLVQGTPRANKSNSHFQSVVYDAVGSPQISEQQTDSGMIGQRACVGKLNGTYSVGSYDDGYTVNVYDKVLWQKAQSPFAIDVFVNNKFFRRVRR